MRDILSSPPGVRQYWAIAGVRQYWAIAGKLPLVLCLHGRGGNTVAANIAAGKDKQSSNPCFVMAPTTGKEARWGNGPSRAKAAGRKPPRSAMPELMETIADLIKNHPIDTKRIYITGQSMGGAGTWSIILAYPDMFAAAAPVCGWGDVNAAAKIKDIPLWVFHGGKDAVVPVTGSRDMVAAIKKAGGHPQFTEYEGVGHNSWGRAYATDELWVWMFKQSRK